MRTRITLALTGIVLGIAAIFTSGYAHADPSDLDSQFLSLMQRDGISNNQGLSAEIAVAHWVCTKRMDGQDEATIAEYIYQNSGLSAPKTAAMVTDSEQVYCPAYIMGPSGTVT